MVNAFETLVRDTQIKLHNIFLKKSENNPGRNALKESAKIPWSWVAVSVSKILSEYPTGLTDVVLLSILELMWEKAFIRRFKGFDKTFNTIQAVYDSSTSETFLLEVKSKFWEAIKGSNNYQLTATDEANVREIDIFMHPKYSQWISLPNFFTDRKLRMICPPKSNAPILNRTNDTTLHRRFRIPLIPPTDLVLIMLEQRDKEFIKQTFFDRIRKNQEESNQYKLWLKIIHVELVMHTSASGVDQKSKIERTDIYLIDMSSDSVPIVFSLYDKQTQLASILRRNDYIGLYHPKIRAEMGDGSSRGGSQSEILFEYSNDSVLFLMPEKEAQEAGLSKVNLVSMIGSESSYPDPKKDIAERDEEGFIDCSNYLSRIYVKDLSHRMINVTLLGKVVGLANNNPFIKGKNNQKMDRYALRIEDSTGTMDITLWEDAGRNSRKIKVGQYVLLDSLATSDKHVVGNKEVWYVNGSVVCGTKTYNISTLSCLLSSSSFRSIVPLWYAKETGNHHFQIEGIIVGWEIHLNSEDDLVLSDDYSQLFTSILPKVDFLNYSLGDRITTFAHSNCLLPINPNNKLECEFCGCDINQDKTYVFRPKTSKMYRDWEGWIEWKLDDGTSTCNFFGGEETLLNVTTEHFRQLSHNAQIRLLNSVIGLSIICSVSGNGTSAYRLDQMILLEPTQQECRDMLENIDKK